MNNKEFISELSRKLGYTNKDTSQLVSSVIGVMTQELQDGNNIAIQGFGTFEVKKKLERISINPATQQRMLIPPKLVLTYKPSVTLKRKSLNKIALIYNIIMSEKVTIQDIIELLAEKHSMTKKDAEIFVKGMFELIEEALVTEKYVKVKGLGTFKLTEVESRESVNVNTGERIEIQGHTKISFYSDSSMKDLINKTIRSF